MSCCGTCQFWYFKPDDPSAFHFGECCYCAVPIPSSAGEGRKCSCWEQANDVSDENFAAAFHKETEGQDRLSRRIVIMLCILFHWSPLKVIRRAEGLGLTKPGTAQWFNDNDWFTQEHWDQVISEQEF